MTSQAIDGRTMEEQWKNNGRTMEEQKGHAQRIAFVLQFGKFCGLNRMFLNGDLR